MLSTQNKQVNGSSEPGVPCQNEGELVIEWLNREGHLILRTHQKVDADAAFSAALMMEFRKGLKLDLKPASFATNEPNVLAVDMLEGSNAVKGLAQGSAFGLLVEVLSVENDLIERCFGLWAAQLNLTDSAKQCNDRVVLADLVRAWHSVNLSDKTIVNRARELIRGKLRAERARLNRQRNSEYVPIISKVALVVDKRIDRTTLFKRGAKAIVQESDCGQCIHLSRHVMNTGHDLRELKNSLPASWFIHPQGFLAAYGTPKAPRDPAESGMPIEALFILVQNWIGGI